MVPNEEEIIAEAQEEKEPEPLEVKVVNKEVRESSPYDGHDDYEYDDLNITDKEIEEFDNDSTSSE